MYTNRLALGVFGSERDRILMFSLCSLLDKVVSFENLCDYSASILSSPTGSSSFVFFDLGDSSLRKNAFAITDTGLRMKFTSPLFIPRVLAINMFLPDAERRGLSSGIVIVTVFFFLSISISAMLFSPFSITAKFVNTRFKSAKKRRAISLFFFFGG